MIDDTELMVVLTDELRKAAKDHRCSECGRTIAKGEQYRYERGVTDGRMATYRTCGHCLVARDWIIDQCGGWVYGYVREEINEHWQADSLLHGFDLGRLVVGMNRSWKRRDGELMPVP